VDLLEEMLLLDPETRVTAAQGLAHPFLSEYHDPESEPESRAYDDSFESLELDIGEWKSTRRLRAKNNPLIVAQIHFKHGKGFFFYLTSA